MGLWAVVCAVGTVVSDSAILGAFQLIAWVFLPIVIFFDSKYAQANCRWNPGTRWAITAAIPIVSLVVGGAYLYRRHNRCSAQ